MGNYAEDRIVRGRTIAGHALLKFTATLSPAQVPTITTLVELATFTGLQVGDLPISLVRPTEQAGLGIAGLRVSAVNVLAINFMNPTAAGITPTASEVYTLLVMRPDAGVGPGLS